MAFLITPSAAIYLQHKLPVNRVSANPVKTTSSLFYQASYGSGRWDGLSFETKAKLSVDANVVDKESTHLDENLDFGVVGVHHVGVL